MASATEAKGFAASQSPGRTALEFGLIVVILVALVLVARMALGGLAEQAALALPPAADAKVGEAAARAVMATHASPVAPEKRARVEQAFAALVEQLTAEERARLGSPAVTLVTEGTPNAFALPGGQVFVHDGLLERVGAGPEGDAQLRGVLAHELGHAVRRHALRLLARRLAFGVAIGVLMGNGDRLGDTLLAGAGQLVHLENSRDMETEADDFGADLLARAGADVSGLATFLEGLGSQPVPDVLSTHPDPVARAARLRARPR